MNHDDDTVVARMLTALAHPVRLAVIRQLVATGPAGRAAERLARLGYTEVYHYGAGKRAWQAEGLSLEH